LKILSSERSSPDYRDPEKFHGSEKFVLNLSDHVLTQSEISVLKRGLTFAAAIKLDMVCVAESAERSKLPPRLGYGVLFEISMYVGKIKTFDI
jgi:hypothetical protein